MIALFSPSAQMNNFCAHYVRRFWQIRRTLLEPRSSLHEVPSRHADCIDNIPDPGARRRNNGVVICWYFRTSKTLRLNGLFMMDAYQKTVCQICSKVQLTVNA